MSATAALHRTAAPDLDRLTAAGMTFDRRTSPVHASSAESIPIRTPTRRSYDDGKRGYPYANAPWLSGT